MEKMAIWTRIILQTFSPFMRFWSVLLAVLVVPVLWYSLIAAPKLSVDVGVWGDHTVLEGINGIEQSSSENYRWTTGHTTLTLPNLSQRYRLLQLRAHGWRPGQMPAPHIRLSVADAAWGSFATTHTIRVYSILLPPDDSALTRVTFDSDVYGTPEQQV